MAVTAFARRHPVPVFYLLTFGISWGLVLALVGPDGFFSLSATHPSFVIAGSAWCLGPSVAGIAMIGLTDGRAGLRDYVARLRRWRVGVRWLAIALLLAPLTATALAFALSLASPAFLPAFLTAEDTASLVIMSIPSGLMIALLEETGWTGFATPRLLRNRGVLAAGLPLGLVWAALHLPLFAGTARSAGAPVPVALLAFALFVAWLPPYRVLMVWVYARTRSVLVVVLTHVPIVFNQYVVNPLSPDWEGSFTFLMAFGASLWVIVAACANWPIAACSHAGALSTQRPSPSRLDRR